MAVAAVMLWVSTRPLAADRVRRVVVALIVTLTRTRVMGHGMDYGELGKVFVLVLVAIPTAVVGCTLPVRARRNAPPDPADRRRAD